MMPDACLNAAGPDMARNTALPWVLRCRSNRRTRQRGWVLRPWRQQMSSREPTIRPASRRNQLTEPQQLMGSGQPTDSSPPTLPGPPQCEGWDLRLRVAAD